MARTLDERRIADCYRLYSKYGGGRHELIEQEMRDLGWDRFTRRSLYTRKTPTGEIPGWIERFGWKKGRDAGKENDVATRRWSSSEISTSGIDSSSLRPAVPASFPPSVPASDSFPDFADWLGRVSPHMTWNARHHEYVIDKLDKVTKGEIPRLAIFMPPRHGKSEMVTVRYSAWRMLKAPATKVMIASYNQELANTFSRKIKQVILDDAAVVRESEKVREGEGEIVRQGEGETVDARRDAGSERRSSNKAGSSPANDPSLSHLHTLSPSSPTSRYDMFPFTRQRPRNSASQWETLAGGSLRAVGVGGGATGFGGDLIVIDDPVKDRADAESPRFRKKMWEWYTDVISTRLEPGGAIILILTRWHEDDLAGRLLQEMENGGDEWTVVSLPALAAGMENGELRMENVRSEDRSSIQGSQPSISNGGDTTPTTIENGKLKMENVRSDRGPATPGSLARFTPDPPFSIINSQFPSDPLGRSPGEALWPEKFDRDYFLSRKRLMGSYAFAALYQQTPTPAEGSIFKREWFERNIVTEAPAHLEWKRGYDLAVSRRTTADYTASFRIALDERDGTMYIADGFRKRLEFPDQRKYIIERIKMELRTEHGIELALHGQALLQDLRRDIRTAGKRVRGIAVETDKVTRALAWSPLAEEGRIRLVRGPWIEDFIDELCAFPSGASDDQVDAVSIAHAMLKQRRYLSAGV